MTQFRVLHDEHGAEIDINPEQVEAIEKTDAPERYGCIVRMHSGRTHFPKESRDEVRYILAMQFGGPFIKPLPEYPEASRYRSRLRRAAVSSLDEAVTSVMWTAFVAGFSVSRWDFNGEDEDGNKGVRPEHVAELQRLFEAFVAEGES